MSNANTDDISTVKKLREYLDNLEASWSETDEIFLGKFEDFPVSFFESGKGYSPAVALNTAHPTLLIVSSYDYPPRQN